MTFAFLLDLIERRFYRPRWLTEARRTTTTTEKKPAQSIRLAKKL
jgi:hypothetical protein